MLRSGQILRRLLLSSVIMVVGVAVIVIAAANRSPARAMVNHDTHGSWLGVSVQDLTESMAKDKNFKVDEGAIVSDVFEQSPAEEAGIEEGDVIVKFDGRDIDDADDLVRAVHRADVGKTAEIIVIRDGKEVKLQATLEKKSRPRHAFRFRPRALRIPGYFAGTQLAGMELQELNKQLGEYFSAPNSRGVLVTEVEEESAAADAGFKAGDVIVKVNDERVRDVEDVWDGFEDVEEGEKAKFDVIRKGRRLTVELERDEPEDISFERFQFCYPGYCWTITVPEIPKKGLELFREDMRDMMKEFREKFQKEIQNLRRELRTIMKA